MHTSFTGNSRKPRQVNLSGRNANPWAKTSGSGSAKQSQSIGNAAIVHAQEQRVQRAYERDRLTATRKVQRVWRGHAARKHQRQKWRFEWDKNEENRLQEKNNISYQTLEESKIASYDNERQLRCQTQLLLHFLDVYDNSDCWRLCYFGRAISASWQYFEGDYDTLLWSHYFSKLSRITIRALAACREPAQRRIILRLGLLLLQKPIKLDYQLHFQCLDKVRQKENDSSFFLLISDYTQALLMRKDSAAYDAFVQYMLTTASLQTLPQITHFLAIRHHQTLYCESVVRMLPLLKPGATVWLLANTIYVWHNVGEHEKVIDWIGAISATLTKSANLIAESLNTGHKPLEISFSHDALPLNDTFVEFQINSLPIQDSVKYVMAQFRSLSSSVADIAKPLANYSVAMLRAFPSKATNIRMWLFQNSPSSTSESGTESTIQYLWQASRSTSVFQTIQHDQDKVISVLTECRPQSNQFGYQPPKPHEVSAWEEEWRIILLFLELYTFILQLMDDEEFFAFEEQQSMSRGPSQHFRQGALPLEDIAVLGTFLKSLAFSLIWYADRLSEYNEVEDTATLSTVFGNTPVAMTAHQKPLVKTLAGNDVSQTYMKGLATGLLRMLYERDSRRNFLPDGYWLMTRHFDMQTFIPQVAAEEERRHEAKEAGEDDDIEIEQFDEDEESTQVASVASLFNHRTAHMPHSQNSRQADKFNKQRELNRKRRQLQSLNPRLEILRNLPFFIPFHTRVQIFRTFVHRDQQRRRNGYVDPDDWRMSVAATQARGFAGRSHAGDLLGRHHANIHRGSVFEDALESFFDLGEELKEPIQISFIDQFGQPEAGIDGGGVTKEFLMSVTSEAFDPNSEMAMFEENEQRYLYPKPTAMQQVHQMLIETGNSEKSEGYIATMRAILKQYEFLGRIVGKCMYEGILIDVIFAGFFLLKWALTGGTTAATMESTYRASINDLRDFDDQLYQGLLKLKNYTGDVEADFSLNFAVTDTFEVDGRMVSTTTDLIPNGANVAVNNQNRSQYINRMVRYRLQEQPRLITNFFLRGLGTIISPMWLAMFNQNELQKLVGGDSQELDIMDLRRNTQYGGVYQIGDDGLEHPTVAMFWKVLREMNDSDRRKVLKFVTSTPRAPLLGFGHLNPKFSIRDSSEDQTRLPSTSTCVNLLKLPRYADERTMREKLLYAANAGAGFDLS